MNHISRIHASKDPSRGSKVHLDELDLTILDILQANSKIKNSQLAIMIGLSESACFTRVKKLQEQVISNYTIRLSQDAMPSHVLVQAHVTLECHKYASCSKFEQIIHSVQNVYRCDYVAGQYDYILNLICRDMSHYSDTMEEISARHGGISHYVSQVVLRKVKDSPTIASCLFSDRDTSRLGNALD